MNGIGLLMLLALSGQAGLGTERDYGWEFNQEGVLQYIVQISPQKADMMRQQSVQFPNGVPVTSEIPAELVGRVGAIKILIGTQNLPRTPSLDELRKYPRASEAVPSSSTAQLGIPKYVEPELRPIVQADTPPSLPSFPEGQGIQLSDAIKGTEGEPGNLIDQAKNAALEIEAASAPPVAKPDPSLLAQNGGNNGLADSFMNSLRSNSNNNSKFNNTGDAAITGANPVPTNTVNPNSQAGLPPLPATNPATNANPALNAGNGQRDNTNWQTQNPVTGIGRSAVPNEGYVNTPPNSGNFTSVAPQQTPSPTFGSTPAFGNRGTAVGGGYPANSYAPPPGSVSYPPDRGYDRMASNVGTPAANPAPTYQQPVQSVPNGGFATGQANPSSPSNYTGYGRPAGGLGTGTSAETGAGQNPITTTGDTALRLSFLTSLIVNVYLGFLMRRLLMRYRSLLVNARSQLA